MKRIKENLSDIVAKEIITKIIRGEFEKGKRLPPEKELTEFFQVSRVTLRESIKQLVAKGLLDVRQGEGTFIRKVNTVSVFSSLLPMLTLEDIDIRQLYEARSTIETGTITYAVQKANKKDIEVFDEFIKNMEASIENNDLRRYSQLDIDFHVFISKVSRNKVLSKTLDTIREILGAFIEVTNDRKIVEKSFVVHKKIVECVRNRDEKMARKYMEEHTNVMKDIIDNK